MHRQIHAYHRTAFGNAERTALDRLLALERALDDFSRAALRPALPPLDGRALEIGAGAGSIAVWLAEQLTEGEVVATELDISFLPISHPRMRSLIHDVTVDPFPPEAFDLIHARAVYEHLADPESTMSRTLDWIAPGGWIVLEGIDLTLGTHSPHHEVSSSLTEVVAGMVSATGIDMTFERTLPRLLHRHGLVDISLCVQPLVCGDGGAAEQFLRISLEQMRPMLRKVGTPAGAIDGFLEWLETPGNLDTVFAVTTVSARRPEESPRRGET